MANRSNPKSKKLKKSNQQNKPVQLEKAQASTQSQIRNEMVHATQEYFSGPLPPPEILAQYEAIEKGLGNRIVSMAERQAEHRQQLECQALEAEIAQAPRQHELSKRGQNCGLTIGVVALLSASFCAYVGQPWTASLIGAGGIGSLVGAFLVGRRQSGDSGDQG